MRETLRFPSLRLRVSVRLSTAPGSQVVVSIAPLAGIRPSPSTTPPKFQTTAARSALDQSAAAIASFILLRLICSGAHGPLFCPNPIPCFARRIVVLRGAKDRVNVQELL